MLLSKECRKEQQFISLYKGFINDNPDMEGGRERRKAFLKEIKVSKGSHIHKFFMQDLNVDSRFSQKLKELKENPKNSDKIEFQPLRRRK